MSEVEARQLLGTGPILTRRMEERDQCVARLFQGTGELITRLAEIDGALDNQLWRVGPKHRWGREARCARDTGRYRQVLTRVGAVASQDQEGDDHGGAPHPTGVDT